MSEPTANQQAQMLALLAAQAAAAQNPLNMLLPQFGWGFPGAADFMLWNSLTQAAQTGGSQQPQESFEDVLKKMTSPNSKISSLTNGKPFSAPTVTMRKPQRSVGSFKTEAGTSSGTANSSASSSASGSGTVTPKKTLEPGEIPKIRETSKHRNGQIQASALPSGVEFSAELLDASMKCWAMFNQLATGSATTSHQNDIFMATLQNAANIEKARARFGGATARKTAPLINKISEASSRRCNSRPSTSSDVSVTPTTSRVTVETPLDLSNHQRSSEINHGEDVSTSPAMCGRATNAVDQYTDFDQSKKRAHADASLVRIPLSLGWRRQTCIRSISATGVRGDVIYYAPCGKRLGSYAEVVRYLNKRNITTIGREHFSFSCKIIVGEFILIKPSTDASEKTISKISENEVLAEIARLSGNSSRRSANPSNPPSSSEKAAPKTNGSSDHEKVQEKSQDEKVLKHLQRQMLQQSGDQLYAQLLFGLGQQLQQAVVKADSSFHQKSQASERKKLKVEVNQHSKHSLSESQPKLSPSPASSVVSSSLPTTPTTTSASLSTTSAAVVPLAIPAAVTPPVSEVPENESTKTKQEKEEEEREERQPKIRQPIDDLLLEEARKLPAFDRFENLTVTGPAFADALMIIEFVHNFGHVLKIDTKLIPTLSDFLAGLQNDPDHLKGFLRLTKILLQLVLEYPGLPAGLAGRTPLGQALKEIGIHRENYSELMKMFLLSREEPGKQLGAKLESCSFEVLDPESKAAILAFFCNELLYCRNIVREIEGNMEEITRIKGEKWLREGKVRALRGVQAKRRLESSKKKLEKLEAEDAEQSRANTPGSVRSEASEETDGAATMVAPTPVTPRLKALTPGLGQCDILTPEEEEMDVDGLEKLIGKLNSEADELREKYSTLSDRVRVQPLGQDRFHRYYWMIPRYHMLVVESLASASLHNPAVNVDVTCMNDPPSIKEDPFCYVDPDVIGFMEDMVDSICKDEEQPSKGKKVRLRRLDNCCKRGWWVIKDEKKLEQLRGALHGRGIRERVLHRVLTKENFQVNFRSAPDIFATRGALTAADLNTATIERLNHQISLLEAKIVAANMHCRPISTVNALKDDDLESEDSQEAWNKADIFFGNPTTECSSSYGNCIADYAGFGRLKERLLETEKCIERRYFLHRYHAGSLIPVERVLGIQSSDKAAEQGSDTADSLGKNGSTMEAHVNTVSMEYSLESGAMAIDESGDTELLERWRKHVHNARTSGQLMFCIQALDSAIAWEKSIMKASCQICRTGENESQLLLCDACDMGYHMYCFRPRIETIPEGEWFCPLCIQRACRKTVCLLCARHSDNQASYICSKCYNGYHVNCFDRPPQVSDPKQWTCPGCLNADGSPAELENALVMLPSDVTIRKPLTKDNTENENGGVPNGTALECVQNGTSKKIESPKAPRSAQKRKVTSTDYDFPHDMMVSLLRAMLDEIWIRPEAGPFQYPVDPKVVPLYRKVIKKPMDLSQMKANIDQNKYDSQDSFLEDLELIFENCRTFNEDESEIGKAGISLHKFYTKRWKQLRYNYSKRLKRMKAPRTSVAVNAETQGDKMKE